jgi:hypothetical protein
LHCYCLLWFIAFAMFCYYFLLWFIIPHLAMLLFVIVHRLYLTMLLLLFDVIHHSLPCIVVSLFHAFFKYSLHPPMCCWCYLLWFVTPHLVLLFVCWSDVISPFLPCAGYGDRGMKCHVPSLKLRKVFLFLFFFQFKSFVALFSFYFFPLLMFLALFNLVFCFSFWFYFFSFFCCRIILFLNSIVTF